MIFKLLKLTFACQLHTVSMVVQSPFKTIISIKGISEGKATKIMEAAAKLMPVQFMVEPNSNSCPPLLSNTHVPRLQQRICKRGRTRFCCPRAPKSLIASCKVASRLAQSPKSMVRV
jgi:hypothetical protein